MVVYYQAELSDYRQQVRYNYASNVITFWPKAPDVGNVSVTGSPTYSVFAPDTPFDGTALASGTISPTTVEDCHKLTVTINTTTTASWPIDEGYRVDITYVYSSVSYLRSVYFDVAAHPYTPIISLNDMVEEVADSAARLTAQAARIESARTAQQHASVLGVKAWADIASWIRLRVERDQRIVPSAIIDHEALKRVVVAKAVSRMYRAEGGGGDTESFALADWWDREALSRFEALPPIKYDSSQNLVGDSDVQSFVTVKCSRSW